jgi:hypothetical protein
MSLVSWVYRNTYVGPNRRSDQFQVRFLERRRAREAGARDELGDSLRRLFAQGLKWVSALNYFGPDRRGDDYNFFFLERRRANCATTPPPLATALRQLRVRLADIDAATAGEKLRERILATAMLADAQACVDIGDMLMTMADKASALCDGNADRIVALQDELNRIEARLAEGDPVSG